MKKKIKRDFILTAFLGICLTTLLVTVVFYEFFKKQMMEELATCAVLLEQTGALEEKRLEQTGALFLQYRITFIGNDGSVWYDNDVEIGGLTTTEIDQKWRRQEKTGRENLFAAQIL